MSNLIRIGVLADTHAESVSNIPPTVLKDFAGLDLIVHLGDFDSPQFLEELKTLGNFSGVYGNHDYAIKDLLPEKDILRINGKRIGLIHGHGCSVPFGLTRGLRKHFKKDDVDAILYGHTHLAVNKTEEDGILFFNPGSAIARFPAAQNSYGILTVGDTVTATIHYFKPQQDTGALATGTKSSQRLRSLAAHHERQWCSSIKRSVHSAYDEVSRALGLKDEAFPSVFD